jgi:uncharacterized membrane protein
MRVPLIFLVIESAVAFPRKHVTLPSFKPAFTSSSLARTRLEMVCYPVSGIDSLPEIQQQLVFASVFLGLGAGTTLMLKVFDGVEELLPENWFANWKSSWPLLGAVYMLAGAAHFGVKESFQSIYPPQGTWGLWYLPGSPEFHVAWTGVAEFLGGLGLVGGSLLGKPSLTKASAAALVLLTLAITPANIYMFTHGAIMVGAGPDAPLEVQFHAIRFGAQILLLGFLAGMAIAPTPDDAKAAKEAS